MKLIMMRKMKTGNNGEVIDFSAVPTSWMINSILGVEKKKRERGGGRRFFSVYIYISNATRTLIITY